MTTPTLTATSAHQFEFDWTPATQDYHTLLADKTIHPVIKQNLITFVKFIEMLATPATGEVSATLRANLFQQYPLVQRPVGLVDDQTLNLSFARLLQHLRAGRIYIKFASTSNGEMLNSGVPQVIQGLRDLGHSAVEAVWILPVNMNMQAAQDNVNLLHRVVTQGLLLSFGVSASVRTPYPGRNCLELPRAQMEMIRTTAGQLMYAYFASGRVNTFAQYPLENMLLYLFKTVTIPIRNQIRVVLTHHNKSLVAEYAQHDSLTLVSILAEIRRDADRAVRTRAGLRTLAHHLVAHQDRDGHLFQILDEYLGGAPAAPKVPVNR